MLEQAIFSFVIKTIADLVIREARFLDGVDDQIGNLQQELKQISWFLRDADAHQETRERVHEWVLRARDLGYEAEDLIETYAFKIASNRRGGVAGKLKRFACLFDEGYLHHQLGLDIDSLLKKISNLTKNLHEYGIKSITENKDGSSSNNGGGSSSSGGLLLRRTYSVVAPAEDIFVGVDKDVVKLADILVGDVYAVVGLCGMGGLGKTTLARKVYHHLKVRSHFEGFVWLCISQQWNKKDILSEILIKFMPEKRKDIEKWRDAELVRELSQFLQNKQCLVVLDDMWKVDPWESIKHAFPVAPRGSKVVITTRYLNVFMQIDGNGFLHEPRFLSEDESWELICKKGVLRRYVDQDSQDYHKFEELGKDMVTHCGGLPLAVVILGGILASKGNYSEWVKVHRHIKSFVGNGKNSGIDEGKISQVLALSYDELPFKLKPCFLYLSRYAEDEAIKLEPLYQIWMAEGMISAEDRLADETMMEVAERYLGELAERCMVFVEKKELLSFLELKSCRLHDLMRDLCLLKAREENFLELAVDTQDSSSLSGTTFRLAINLLDGIHAESFIQPTDAVSQRLRSFSLVVRDPHNLAFVEKMKVQFGKFMLLRVLCLEGCDLRVASYLKSICVASYLKSICTLVHLRYMSLRNSRFNSVPSSISSLKHLHTLDLRSHPGYNVSISSGIESLEQLKHLYLPNYFTCNDGNGRKLVLHRLRKLEILENFDSKQCEAKHLSCLTNLRSFSAKVYDNESLEVFVSQVCNLSYLQFLSLVLDRCVFLLEEELAVLRGVFSLNCLTALKIQNCRIDRLPAYEAGFCKNLHTLTLNGTLIVVSMVEDPFSMLEKFPNLINLSLQWCYGGRDMYIHAHGFSKLRSLWLVGLNNLENWIIEDGAMPHLSQLYIGRCSNLKTVPEGVRFLTSLKKLILIGMGDEFNSGVQVKDNEEGADFGIVCHIPSIQVKDFDKYPIILGNGEGY